MGLPLLGWSLELDATAQSSANVRISFLSYPRKSLLLGLHCLSMAPTMLLEAMIQTVERIFGEYLYSRSTNHTPYHYGQGIRTNSKYSEATHT